MKRNNLRVLAVFDIDKTLKSGYSIIDFAKYLKEQGKFKISEWQRIEEGMIQHKAGKLGYNLFADIIVEAYGAGIAGQKEEEVLAQSTFFWEKYQENIFGYVKDLFEQLIVVQAETVAMSGSDKWSLGPLLTMLNFTRIFVTDYEVVAGVFTGRVTRNAASLQGKEELVEEAVGSNSYDVILGFGDSVADLAFLRVATHAFVMGRHDKELVAEAEEKGWTIVDDPNAKIEIMDYVGERV